MNTRALLLSGLLAGTFALLGCTTSAVEPVQAKPKVQIPKNAATLVVGGGCFWCLESQYEELKGVYEVESGYAGGETPNATYKDLGSGAEVVKVFFDPKVITRDDLLHIFFVMHDPTTLNRQGPDVGPQYRSVVFYANSAEKALATKIRDEISKEKLWQNPIVTTLEPLKNYSRAEEHHQDYFAKFLTATPAQRATMNGGYCTAIIEPKVAKFREKYAHLLKKGF